MKTTMIRALAVLLVCIVLITPPSYSLSQYDILSDAAILIDRETGQILFEKNADALMYPASTTKIMTALIILEQASLDDVVTVTEEAALMEGSSISLDYNEKMTVRDLLYGLLVASGNDAATALAIHHSGSQAEFAKLMTERAHQLGAYSTQFANPHGLHDPSHFTTAYDLALIANEAMKNELFRTIVSTAQYQIAPTNRQPETRYLNNTNALIPDVAESDTLIEIDGEEDVIAYEYVTGVKTGYTEEAGRCLVSSAQKNGREVIAVVLHSEHPAFFQDSKRLLIYGLDEMASHYLFDPGEVIAEIELHNPERTKVRLIPGKAVSAILPLDVAPSQIQTAVTEIGTAELPISVDEPIAELRLTYDGQTLRKLPLFSDVDIAGVDLINDEITRHSPTVRIPYGFILINVAALLFLWRLVNTIAVVQFGYKRRKRKKARPEVVLASPDRPRNRPAPN